MKTYICTFCLEEKDSSKFSDEHIFPFSLGNDSLILKNMVCSRCNNEALSEIDSVLLEHYPIKTHRALYGVKNRAGNTTKYTSSDQYDVLYKDNAAHISIPCKNKMPHKHDRSSDELKLTMRVNKLSNKKSTMLARALLKIVYESIGYNRGREFVLQDGFNNLRSFIAKGSPAHGGFIAHRYASHGKQCFAVRLSEKGKNIVTIHNIEYMVGVSSDDLADQKKLNSALQEKSYSVIFWGRVL